MKNNLTCIIIDDDELDRFVVENELVSYQNINILGSYSNPLDAVGTIKNQQTDILFLDIDMPGISGIDFVKSITQLNTINIFITSHPEYALAGFQLKVFDYILKPLETDRFKECINRIEEFVELKGKAAAYDVLFENEMIIFKEGYNVVNLNLNDVIYLEAYGDYTKIVTANKSHLALSTLSSFLESLPIGKFMRIHRSYVVAIKKIKEFSQKSINMGINTIPIGKTFLKETKQILKYN